LNRDVAFHHSDELPGDGKSQSCSFAVPLLSQLDKRFKDALVVLSAERMARLPPELRHELGAALWSLKSDAVTAAILRIREHDPALTETLHRLAARFDYQVILDALGPE
jgi:hypothetical protein